jgi:hypothetical protein
MFHKTQKYKTTWNRGLEPLDNGRLGGGSRHLSSPQRLLARTHVC